jgi:hypothetical protein
MHSPLDDYSKAIVLPPWGVFLSLATEILIEKIYNLMSLFRFRHFVIFSVLNGFSFLYHLHIIISFSYKHSFLIPRHESIPGRLAGL